MYVNHLLKAAPVALKFFKKEMAHSIDLKRHFARALEQHRQMQGGQEATEGLSAFIEKRAPHWVQNLSKY